MKYSEMFRKEFYEIVGAYPNVAIIKGIKLMNKNDYVSLYMFFRKDSTKNVNSNMALFSISRLKGIIENEVLKKNIRKVFNKYTVSTIKKAFYTLSYASMVSLLKEYTFSDEYVLRESLSEIDLVKNEKSIIAMREYIDEKISRDTPFVSFFKKFNASKEMILLATLLLCKEYRDLIVLKYGTNLDYVFKQTSISEIEFRKINEYVFPNIDRNIELVKVYVPSNIVSSLCEFLSNVSYSDLFDSEDIVNKVWSMVGVYLNKVDLHAVFPGIKYSTLKTFVSFIDSNERVSFYREYGYSSSLKLLITKEEKDINDKNFKKLKKWISNYYKYTNLCSIIGVTIDEIKKLVNHLSDSDRYFLSRKAYNSGYLYPTNIATVTNNISLNRLDKIIDTLLELKVTLYEEKISVNIFDVVESRDLDEIESACFELYILDYMINLFGEDLSGNFVISKSSIKDFMYSTTIVSLNNYISGMNRNESQDKIRCLCLKLMVKYFGCSLEYKNLLKECKELDALVLMINKYFGENIDESEIVSYLDSCDNTSECKKKLV